PGRCGGAERGRALGDGLLQRFQAGLVQRADQGRAVAERAEQRALAHSGRRRHVGHRDVLGFLAAGEEVVGGGEEGLPVAGGVLARTALTVLRPAVPSGAAPGPWFLSRTYGDHGDSSPCLRSGPAVRIVADT